MDKNSKNTVDNTRGKGLKPPWKKGDKSPNPNGRPKGQRNYATIYREALIKLGELNNKTPDELEDEIISKGILNARSGDYHFYKDILDRLHGQATSKTELTGKDGKELIPDASLKDKIDESIAKYLGASK